ncbi:MAG: TetR family transcriptional regulator [Burkholderiales bacterium]|nr:TetR family transcriptional regulator [Burkholderiales bacterium]
MNEPVPSESKPTQARAEAPARTYDSAQSLADILRVASAEFADKGLAGARIDEIAAATRTSKRMIYYHFESKEALYVAVLEDAYRRVREIEAGLELQDLEPEDALRKLVAFTFDYHLDNEAFIRLVMNENMHRGEYLARSATIQDLNVPAIDAVRSVYERGVKARVFRRGVDPVDLHMWISALCFFNVANRHTFGLIFKRDLAAPAEQRHHRDEAVEMILRYVRLQGGGR